MDQEDLLVKIHSSNINDASDKKIKPEKHQNMVFLFFKQKNNETCAVFQWTGFYSQHPVVFKKKVLEEYIAKIEQRGYTFEAGKTALANWIV